MIPSLIPTWNQSRIKVCVEDVTRALIMEGSKKCYVAFILGIVLLGWGPTVKEHADTTHVFCCNFSFFEKFKQTCYKKNMVIWASIKN